MQKYLVEKSFSTHGTVTIEAENEEQAKALAEDIGPDDLDNSETDTTDSCVMLKDE